jgi:hypothetical protein
MRAVTPLVAEVVGAEVAIVAGGAKRALALERVEVRFDTRIAVRDDGEDACPANNTSSSRAAVAVAVVVFRAAARQILMDALPAHRVARISRARTVVVAVPVTVQAVAVRFRQTVVNRERIAVVAIGQEHAAPVLAPCP